MKKIKNQYFEPHVYEGNILEIEYTSKNIDFMNSAHVDNAIKRAIDETSAKTGDPIIIVLNFKNVEFVNSTAIGVVIAMWNDLKKVNKKETPLYCINLNKNILHTFKMLKMDHRLLLFNFDSIDDIIYFAKCKMNSIINAFNEHCREILLDVIKKNTLNMFNDRNCENYENYTKKNKELSRLWLTLYANII